MTGRHLGMIGLALLIAGATVVGAFLFVRNGDGDDLLVVRGAVGSEKANFLESPEVREILADRYDLRVEFAPAGSLEVIERLHDDQDFLWPASPITIDTQDYPAVDSEEIFYSPVVLYSWAPVTDALVAAGLVQKYDSTYYVTDFPRLIRIIDGGTQWGDIGLPRLDGPISITTTDPTTSNSGSSFAGLLATTYNGGRVVDTTTVDGVLGQVRAFFARLGPLERSTADLFDQYVKQGMGAYPIVAGYEASLIEFHLRDEEPLNQSRDEIRLLYPQPTIWSSHPLIALTPNGEKLLFALVEDEDLQRLAWERHGFRADVFRVGNDPLAFGVAGVPSTFDLVMPLPRSAVMAQIVEALRSEAPVPPSPTGSPVAVIRLAAEAWAVLNGRRG